MRSHLNSRTRLVLTGAAVIAAVGTARRLHRIRGRRRALVDQGTTSEENAE